MPRLDGPHVKGNDRVVVLAVTMTGASTTTRIWHKAKNKTVRLGGTRAIVQSRVRLKEAGKVRVGPEGQPEITRRKRMLPIREGPRANKKLRNVK